MLSSGLLQSLPTLLPSAALGIRAPFFAVRQYNCRSYVVQVLFFHPLPSHCLETV